MSKPMITEQMVEAARGALSDDTQQYVGKFEMRRALTAALSQKAEGEAGSVRAGLVERLLAHAGFEDNGGCADHQMTDVGALLREAAEALALPREQDGAGAVGEAGSMPGTDGFTMAVFKAADVPIGTKLFAHPPATDGFSAGQEAMREAAAKVTEAEQMDGDIPAIFTENEIQLAEATLRATKASVAAKIRALPITKPDSTEGRG